jgi:hypothetical protein
MMTVANIRDQNIRITNEPIVYYWWFKKKCFDNLLNLLKPEIDFERILIREINGETYGLLYIGKGKNGHDRLVKYHIHDSQNFHIKGVQNGRLSSLRQTLCGLLQLQMSSSKNEINNFMNNNCIVEFETCILQNLDTIEHKKITTNYLPLNYQNSKNILTSGHRKILSECKKRMRK